MLRSRSADSTFPAPGRRGSRRRRPAGVRSVRRGGRSRAAELGWRGAAPTPRCARMPRRPPSRWARSPVTVSCPQRRWPPDRPVGPSRRPARWCRSPARSRHPCPGEPIAARCAAPWVVSVPHQQRRLGPRCGRALALRPAPTRPRRPVAHIRRSRRRPGASRATGKVRPFAGSQASWTALRPVRIPPTRRSWWRSVRPDRSRHAAPGTARTTGRARRP